MYQKPLEVYEKTFLICISMESGSKTPNVSTAVPFKLLHELIVCKTSPAKFFLYICDCLSSVLLHRLTLSIKPRQKQSLKKEFSGFAKGIKQLLPSP